MPQNAAKWCKNFAEPGRTVAAGVPPAIEGWHLAARLGARKHIDSGSGLHHYPTESDGTRRNSEERPDVLHRGFNAIGSTGLNRTKPDETDHRLRFDILRRREPRQNLPRLGERD